MYVNFYESNPKKTVVAVTGALKRDIIRHVEKRFPGLYFEVIEKAMKKAGVPQRLTAKATCDVERDEYIYEIGRHIAEYRLRQKYNKALARVYFHLATQFHQHTSLAITLGMRFAASVDKKDKFSDL